MSRKSQNLEHHLGPLHHCHNHFTYQPQVKPLTGLGKKQGRSRLGVAEPGELLGGDCASRDQSLPALPAMNDQRGQPVRMPGEFETMEPGVDDEGADPGSWGHVSCCDHWQPLLVLAAPTVHHLQSTLQSTGACPASVHLVVEDQFSSWCVHDSLFQPLSPVSRRVPGRSGLGD